MAYEQHLTRGLQEAIENTPIEDGKLRFSVDQGRLFLDLKNERVEFTDFVKGLTQEEIFALQHPLPKMYLSSDTLQFMLYHAGRWYVFGANSYDSSGHKIEDTYVTDIYYNDDGLLVKTFGNGSGRVIDSSVVMLRRIEDLEEKVKKLTDRIEILDVNIRGDNYG